MGIFDFFKSKPSPEKFAKLFANFAARNGFPKPLRFDPDKFRFIIGDAEQQFNLHNCYRDYCSAKGSEREIVLAKYLSSLNVSETPKRFEDAKKKLLPILRGKTLAHYVQRMQRLDGKSNALPACRPFSSDAVVMLALDSEHAIQTVGTATLEEWGVTFEEACAAATDNLRDVTVSSFDEISPGLFASAWGDSYDSSRILFPDVIYQLAVGANPVVMIPNRHRLLVAASPDTGTLATMLAIASKVIQEEGRWVSYLMYRFEGGRAVEFVPDDAGLIQQLNELKLHILADDYAQQKAQLQEIHGNEKMDVFIATYQVMENKAEGWRRSLAVWTKAVDTLLPETEMLALAVPKAEGEIPDVKFVKWEDALPVIGHLMERQDEYPPLYRVKEFPTDEQLAAIPEA